MTLLLFDGFDGQDLDVKWSMSGSIPSYTAITRYSNGFAVVGTSTLNCLRSITPSAKIFCGVAFKPTSFASINNVIGAGSDAGTVVHLGLKISVTGALLIYRGNTQIAASAAGIFTLNQWYYIELSGTISDTVGVAEGRVNGTVVVSFTGDTRNAGTSTNFDTVGLGGYQTSNGTAAIVDDLYVCNDQGTRNNTYLGDSKVVALPVTGAGSSSALTPHGSGTNWQNVDELPYSTGDYNSAAAANTKDMYALADPPAGTSTVYGFQSNILAGRTAPGAGSIRSVVRSAGVNYNDTTRALGASVGWFGDVRETNPATGLLWTAAELAAIELGAEVL